MPTHTPEYASLSSLRCPYHNQMSNIAIQSSMKEFPAAPRIKTVPLPSLGDTTAPLPDRADGLYPLDFFSSLPLIKKIELQSMALISPIHIHTPYAHIGTVHGSARGERLCALDLFLHFRRTGSQQLDYHTTYYQMSAIMRAEVGVAFMRRQGRSLDAVTSWNEFSSGRLSRGGPILQDLLLGHNAIWGFEACSAGGYSVVHVTL